MQNKGNSNSVSAPVVSGTLCPAASGTRAGLALDVTGINRKVTFHLSRHTFVTTVTLANGVPIESVSKMLGHSNLKTTHIYAKVVDTKLKEDMLTVKSRYRMG